MSLQKHAFIAGFVRICFKTDSEIEDGRKTIFMCDADR